MECHLKKIYKENFFKVGIFNKTLWEEYAKTIAIFSSIVTIISFLITAQDTCIGIELWIFIFIATLIAIFIYKWRKANILNKVCLSINQTDVEVVIGDIFDQFYNPDKHYGEITVIGVNEYYDIIVDDRIISKKSLHGQYINKIDRAGKLNELNKLIEIDPILKKTGNPKEDCTRSKGRKLKYELGSLFEFDNYILTAFTKFDTNNKAYLSADEYTHFWMKFWENIDLVYSGRTVNIPLMGAGITRFRNGKPTKQQLLETMLWSLKISGFHNTYGDRKIRFIIYEADAKEINFYNIQHNM